MVESVKNDEYGIGYISLSSLKDSGLKGLIYEGVAPTEENVLNGSYKLTRNFNYIVRNEFATEKEQKIVEAFLAFLKTSDALITIQSKDGIVDITGDEPSWDSIKDNYPICLEDNSNITIKFGGSTSVEKIANELSREFSTKCGNFVAEHNHTGSGVLINLLKEKEKIQQLFYTLLLLHENLKQQNKVQKEHMVKFVLMQSLRL